MTCFACENEPSQQCGRCGRPYCEEHGEEFCAVCLEPSSGVPSFTLYRGSLLALLVAVALAVWLLVQPSSATQETSLRPIVVTATAPAGGRTGSPQAQPTATGAAATTGTPAATGTTRPAGTGTPQASGTPGATGSSEYVVVSGDSLSAICEKIQRPASMTVPDCVDQIRKLNGLSGDAISVGDKLKVPTR